MDKVTQFFPKRFITELEEIQKQIGLAIEASSELLIEEEYNPEDYRQVSERLSNLLREIDDYIKKK